MDSIKKTAICIRAINYKDNDKLITLFSPDCGKILTQLRGVKKPKAKLAYAGQPFCFGEYMLSERGGYYTVIGCDCVDQFFDVTRDIDKFYVGSSLLEICNILVKENEANPAMFVVLLKCLKMLAYSKVDAISVCIKFLIEILEISGYKINFAKCDRCLSNNIIKPYFNVSRGSVVCFSCSDVGDVELKNGEYSILRIIENTSFERFENLKFSSNENLKSSLKLICLYFKIKTGESIKCLETILN